MTIEEAARLLAAAEWVGSAPERWADLGCGDGTFTRALASVLPRGSAIEAMDLDAAALGAIPRASSGVAISTHVGDFTVVPWPFAVPVGVLLANSLHYVRDQAGFLRRAAAAMTRPRFLIVEYDTDEPNPWVPHPISRPTLAHLCREAGLPAPTTLGTRPSRYRRAPLYSALIA
jgi:trans-aconitate methyltransferase